MSETHDIREQLTRAWRNTLRAAVDQGAPEHAVIETMAEVAHARFAETFGITAAASYLRLLAEQLLDIEERETVTLVQGEDLARPTMTEHDFFTDMNWPIKDDILY